MERVIDNIIRNAISYSKEKGHIDIEVIYIHPYSTIVFTKTFDPLISNKIINVRRFLPYEKKKKKKKKIF